MSCEKSKAFNNILFLFFFLAQKHLKFTPTLRACYFSRASFKKPFNYLCPVLVELQFYALAWGYHKVRISVTDSF